MTTRYVSQTATNGYVVGNDSNTGLSKALAKLTITSAISASSNGDVIIINDGSYTAATFFDVTAGLSLQAETDHAVTLKCAAGQAQVIRVGSDGQTITIGKLVIDAESNAAASCIGVNGTTARALVLSGTLLRNPGTGRFGVESINSSQVLTLTVENVDFECSTTAGAVYCLLGAAAYVSINGLTVDNSAGPGVSNTLRAPVYINATASAVAHIRRVSGTWKTQSAAVSASFIRMSGARGVIEYNRGMILSGGDTSGCLIRVANDSGVQADSVMIRHNQGVNQTTGGFLILVGADGAGANDNKTNYCSIFGNDVAGTDAATLMHGICVSNSKGGCCFSNTVRNAGIPFLAKLCSEAVYFADNDVVLPYTSTSGSYRSKGSVNLQVAGNRVICGSGKINPFSVIDRDPTIPTLSTNASVVGNSFYSSAQMTKAIVLGGSGDASTATFVLNNYSATYAAGAFVNLTTSYDTTAGWSAAKEITLRSGIPTSADPKFWHTSYAPIVNGAISASAPWMLV